MAINPYRPPGQPRVDQPQGWITKLTHWFRNDPIMKSGRGRDFVVCCGIAYFVDPDLDDVFFAASPSSVHDDQRLRLVRDIVSETLPFLIHDHPAVGVVIVGRGLHIQLVNDYDSVRQPIVRGPLIAAETIQNWLIEFDSDEVCADQ